MSWVVGASDDGPQWENRAMWEQEIVNALATAIALRTWVDRDWNNGK